MLFCAYFNNVYDIYIYICVFSLENISMYTFYDIFYKISNQSIITTTITITISMAIQTAVVNSYDLQVMRPWSHAVSHTHAILVSISFVCAAHCARPSNSRKWKLPEVG